MNPVYQYVTESIMERLKGGVIPWHKTWRMSEDTPRNLVSKKAYRGINVWLLAGLSYSSPYYVSWNQAQTLGGRVKPEEAKRGNMVVFWKMLDDKKTGAKEKIPLLRYYRVFNVSQCEGLNVPDPIPEANHNPIEACEAISNGMPNKPRVEHEKGRAYYSPALDMVGMPNMGLFQSPEAYYATLFHELGHSTGHKSRLNRKGLEDVAAYGSKVYSKEELVAEMTASFLCGEAGIVNSVIDNSAAYIQGWLRALSDDVKMVVHAGGQAQSAADYILAKGKETSAEADGED